MRKTQVSNSGLLMARGGEFGSFQNDLCENLEQLLNGVSSQGPQTSYDNQEGGDYGDEIDCESFHD